MSLEIMQVQGTIQEFIEYADSIMKESGNFEPEQVEAMTSILQMMSVGFVTVKTLQRMAIDFGWTG